ncbi:MAG: hypothetical protein WB992_11715 [Bryobacteraceae bacterium]
MTDPKFNELPIDAEGDFNEAAEGSLTDEQRAERLKKRRGLSINDTIAVDANMSVGARGVETSGVRTGAGAGAGSTYLTPAEPGESPAPTIAPEPRKSGTTPSVPAAKKE